MRGLSLGASLVAIMAWFGIPSSQAHAQVVEGYPDYMIAVANPEALSEQSSAEEALYGWMDLATRWERGRTLKVCFFGGPRPARVDIARVASEWNTVGANIKLDFGDMSDPRICGSSPVYSEIRVSFSQPGYWSKLGKQAETHVPASLPTLNLQRFDFLPPNATEFRRLVIHEFGHALGLQHEHQSPTGSCEQEYNWEVVYNYLGGEPNYWSRQQVDFNMRRAYTPRARDTLTTSFDPESVMIYAFPANFYRDGDYSPCFTDSPGTVITVRDAETLRAAYPFSGPDVRMNALASAYPVAGPKERDSILYYAMTGEEIAEVSSARASDRLGVDRMAEEARKREQAIATYEAEVAEENRRFETAQAAYTAEVERAQREGRYPPPPPLRRQIAPPPPPPGNAPPAGPYVLQRKRAAALERLIYWRPQGQD